MKPKKHKAMDFADMTKVDIEAIADHGESSTLREQAQTYVDWLDDLIVYANDLLSRAANGIGSNPPTNPPPPPPH